MANDLFGLREALAVNPYYVAGARMQKTLPKVLPRGDRWEDILANVLAQGTAGAMTGYGRRQAEQQRALEGDLLLQALETEAGTPERAAILERDPMGRVKDVLAEQALRQKFRGQAEADLLSPTRRELFGRYIPGLPEDVRVEDVKFIGQMERAKQQAEAREAYGQMMMESQRLRGEEAKRKAEKQEWQRGEKFPSVNFKGVTYKPLEAMTSSQANKFSDYSKSYGMMDDAFDEMENILDRNQGAVPMSGPDRTKYSALYSKVFSGIRKLDETGMRLEPSELQLIRSQLPATFWTDPKGAATNKLLGASTRDELAKARMAADLTMSAALKAGRFSESEPLELKGPIYEGETAEVTYGPKSPAMKKVNVRGLGEVNIPAEIEGDLKAMKDYLRKQGVIR